MKVPSPAPPLKKGQLGIYPRSLGPRKIIDILSPFEKKENISKISRELLKPKEMDKNNSKIPPHGKMILKGILEFTLGN